ncbi:MAG: NADH-quinone oxidoreductase subunit C [Chloroflexi bacterium]|nr:NADH-quinone oxidoreductase subunit C [Chloroflexota bacterium]
MKSECALASPHVDIDIDAISAKISDSITRVVRGAPPAVYIRLDRLLEVCRFLKETAELEFNYLSNLTAVDYLDRMEVVYHLYSISRKHAVTLKVEVDRERASVPSVTGIWRGADFQEREVYDLLGVTFVGHPNLKRILLYDEFVGHPLRKDFALPKD